MPATQPEGAIRTLAGSFVDAIFSNDGLRFFTVSGNTVTVVNSADGTTVKTYTIGTQLGAIDISQNGRYLAVVEEQPGGSTGVLYRIDLTNGAIATFSIPGTSALHDVAFLADGSVVVSQENSAPLRVVTLGTSAYWIASGEIRPNATISVSADATYFIAQPPGIDWPLHGFDTETGTGYAVYYDPYAGAGVGLGGSAVGAVSPDGGMVVQGMTMRVYQSDFSSSISLSAIHPEIYNPAALAFSPDGSKLYVLVANIDKLIVLDTNNWATLASYPIGADALNPSEWSAGTITPGEMMRVSGDGNFLSIITPGGIQVINLELVIEPNYDGGAGDDTIVGSSAPDTISGAGGNDTLSGGAGNDIIKGDDGNDWLSGGLGADTLTGGSGADTFYFGPTAQSNADHITDLSAGDRIELDAALFSGLELGPLDAAAFVQGAEPSAPEHRIIYNSATGQILFDPDGNGPQNRILFATLEPGTVISAAMFEVVAKATADIESGVTYTLSEDELNLVLTGSAAINGTGNALNNEITGNDGSNQLFGLDGNDTLIGNAGNDLLDGGLGADQLFGGAGDDTYIVDPGDPFESDSFFESADEGIDTIVSARDIFFLPSNFENITLAGGVVADGNDQANILTGNAGINVLAGAGGNDHLIGNAGNDSLQGDEGDDLLDGGDGTDSAGYDRAETGVTVSLAINGPQNTGGAGIDTLISIEILGGSSHDDRLTASAAGNSLFGGSGNDLLFGSSGVDELDGGAGSDIYVIVSAADHSTAEIVDRGFDTGIDEVRFSATTASTLSMFASDSGIERIVIGTGTGPAAVTTGLLAINIDASALGYGVAIDGNNGANRLTGGSGDDDISGRAGDDQLYGGLGNDKLTGGQGTDRLHGGAGDDYYYVNDSTDYVYELTSEGIDRVIASLDYKLGSNVENLSLAGSALVGKGNDLANVLTGNDGANFLFGYGGDDTLIGGAGDDTLSGGLGNDKLTGGVGTDRLYGGAGDDLYVITEATDSVTEYAGEGSDTVQSSITYTLRVNVENLTLTGGLSIDGRGNSLDNLIGGNAGSNKIYGLDGDDRLLGYEGGDRLDGGSGLDVMRGGLGDDTYYVDNAGDRPIEDAGEGTDSVFSSISFSLASNIENLTLTGAAVRATGNASDNRLVGSDGANILNGGAGSDVMRGGLGNDTYYVGEAGDTVVEASGAGRDRVYTNVDFTLGANVEDLFLRGSDPLSATGNSLDNVLRGNGASNELTGGAGADDLRGGAGADSFVFADGDFGGLTASTSDRIIDFSHAEGDVIDLTGVDANSLLADHQAFDFIGTNAFSNVAGQLRFEQVNGNTYVYGDIDGDGIADLMIRLDGNQTLVVGDFIL